MPEYAAFSDLPGTVSLWWDFPAIQKQYAEFIDAYAPVAARLAATETEPEPAEAFRHYVPLLTQWRRLTYLDPGLPTELLPPDCNAVTTRQVFQ
ncbi:PaaX family transcriptional regulator C-terminal domain-containing protein [Streptomyces lateritius]|uniref:PaaX family transcriptional regulator C-terminal domain-containing protein n=1 Tax=Streptomyces lateritius TaxID=67313 RepID=UPI0016755B4E|nr:PaaX family transcriptional regulator C-terminal domain-containing protein [Streptomyces lateritius]GGT72283.1 hypothetical protein GCM10010272_14260 [Streptomyces lateritius]